MQRLLKFLPLAATFLWGPMIFAQIVTIDQSFNGTTAPGWILGGTGYTPVLTAAQGVDPVGSGWLRLTSNGNNQATYAYNNTAINAANSTIAVQFSYASYNGSGADGLTFFLADASKPFGVGAYGGSLGYAQKTAAGGATNINGMSGGYIGLGIDEYGNYSSATEGRVGGVGTGLYPNAIALRGPGQGLTGYDYLGGTGTLATQLAFGSSTTRPTGADSRTVQVVITATNQLTVYLQAGTGAQFVPLYSIDLSGYTRPDQLIMGFTGSTGGATDIHELQNVTLTSVPANLWSNTAGDNKWSTATDWHGSTVPATAADVLLDNTYVGSAQTIDVGQNRVIRSLQIDAPFSYTLNNGALEFNNNGVLGPSGILVSQTHGSATQTINSNLVADNAIEIKNGSSGLLNLTGSLVNNGNTVTVDGGGHTNMSGVISGAGGLVKNDSGTLTLSGANSYTGGTTVNAGVLQLGANNVLTNTGTVTLGASGTLNLDGFSNQIGTLIANGGATLDFGSPTGANTLVFGTYTAPTSGVMVVDNWQQGTDTLASKVGAQDVSSIYLSGYGIAQEAAVTSGTLYGSAYQLTPLAQNGVVWDGSSNNRWNRGANWTGNNVPGTTDIAVFDNTGAGRTAVNLNSSYTIAGLKFDTSAPAYTITGSNTLTLSGVIPYVQQKSASDQALDFSTLNLANNTVFDITGSGNLAVGASLSGSGNLIKDGTGSGKLVLGGNSTGYTGNIYLNSGVTQITSSNALGTSAGTTTISDGAALEVNGGGVSTGENITLQGLGSSNGGAIHNVSGDNTLSGTLTLSGDSRINSDANTLTISGNVTSSANADLTFGGSGNISVTGIIGTGGGGVTKDGAGTVTLSGANTYSGATNVNAGTLALGATNALADSTAVSVASGATLNLNGFSNSIGSIAGVGNVTLGSATLTAGNNSSSTTFSGVISGTGGLTKTGTGSLTLSGNNTYSGGTNVAGGTLQLGASERLANNSAITVAAGATFNLNGYAETIGALSGSGTVRLGGGALNVGSGNASSTFAGSFATGDTGTVQKLGSGTLTLGGAISLSGGNLVLSGGALNLGGFGSSFSSLTVTSNSILDFSGISMLTVGSLTIDPGAVLTIANWSDAVDYFYSLADPGAANLGRIVFNGYSASDTKWQSWDHQITPVPEPSIYGVVFVMLSALGAGYLRRRRPV